MSIDNAYGAEGNAVPDFDLADVMSALFTKPSAFKSSRKLEPVTALPDCDLVWVMSAELTNRSALTSPANTPIGMETLLVFVPSLTPVSVMAMFCAFGTPVQFTVTTLPLVDVVAGCPAHEADVTLMIGAGNVTRIV